VDGGGGPAGWRGLAAAKAAGAVGVGARGGRGEPRAGVARLLDGGGQGRGLRGGTGPLPLAVGFGVAAEIARVEGPAEARTLAALRDRLWAALRAGLPDLRLNGPEGAARLPQNLNVAIPGIAAAALIRDLPEVAVSTGSACTSATVEPSYVLRAIGLSETAAAASLRLAVGRPTTAGEVDAAAAALIAAAARARARAAAA